MQQGKYKHLQPGDKVVLGNGEKATICTLAQLQSRFPQAEPFSGDVMLALIDTRPLWTSWDNYDGENAGEEYSIVSAEIQSTPLNVYLPDNVQATGKRHKHLDLIVLWSLHGALIEYKSHVTGLWEDCEYPTWLEDREYRLKKSIRNISFYSFVGSTNTLILSNPIDLQAGDMEVITFNGAVESRRILTQEDIDLMN